TVKNLALEVYKKLAAEKAGKLAVGQFIYRDTVPALGSYWAGQLAEELAAIPGRSFTLLSDESAGAEWTLAGEIIELANTVRIYTRLLKTEDRSIAAVLHSDLERGEYLLAMLEGGGSSRSSPIARDAYEIDSWENPHPVPAAEAENGPVVNRTLHSSNDEDFFLLSPERDGVLVMETTGNTDTYMELYEAGSRSEIARNDDGGSGSNARIRRQVQAGHRYIAKVRGYDASDTGAYGFRAYFSGQIPSAPDEYEDDNSFSTAKSISIGLPQQHTFSTGNDVDWVKFEVSQAGSYTIQARGINSARLDTCIELFDADRNLIDDDDDGGENMDARLSLRLERGTYYLKVECLDDEPDEPYTITVQGPSSVQNGI
ncbi:MAG: DVUA0089 family protein, partial [Treponema sp.]|nr:DVUA0089 family protein [Treponema sp.]